MSDTTKHKPILAFHRIYRTARGKQKHEVTYYHNKGHDLGRTELMVPCIVENAPPNDPHSGNWTNLLAWYLRTKDLPGARQAYDRDNTDAVGEQAAPTRDEPTPTLAEIEAWTQACRDATDGPWRVIGTDEIDTDPGAAETGATIVARTAGLNSSGQHAVTVLGPPSPGRLGGWGDAVFIAVARTALPRLLAALRARLPGIPAMERE